MVVNAGRSMRTPRRVARLACAATLSAAFVHAVDARAHGFGQRYDLPVPLDLFLLGAAAVVTLSFVVMALFMRRKTAMIAGVPRRSAASVTAAPIVVGICRAAAVILLALTVAAGFFGNPSPVKNIAPIMVWAIW